MPVVIKIEEMRFPEGLRFGVEIHQHGCRITRNWTTEVKPNFGWHQTGDKRISTYEAVVEFIDWYNKLPNLKDEC